jgi:hypothetical protein
MKTLGLAFAVNDRDRSVHHTIPTIPCYSVSFFPRTQTMNVLMSKGYFDFEEFESILGRAGLFLKRQELSNLSHISCIHIMFIIMW